MLYYRYTLIFLTRGDEVLMLHRRNPPNQGFWNGVGGRLEPGESPLAGALREVFEETGYRIENARFAGVLTWDGHAEPAGGVYIFTAEVPPGEPEAHPDDEGILAWKSRAWVVSAPEVVENIHLFGPPVLEGAPAQEFHFEYEEGDRIVSYDFRPLPPIPF